jgi:hypothetical protein
MPATSSPLSTSWAENDQHIYEDVLPSADVEGLPQHATNAGEVLYSSKSDGHEFTELPDVPKGASEEDRRRRRIFCDFLSPWLLLCLIATIIIIAIVLGVGLGVGLKKKYVFKTTNFAVVYD